VELLLPSIASDVLADGNACIGGSGEARGFNGMLGVVHTEHPDEYGPSLDIEPLLAQAAPPLASLNISAWLGDWAWRVVSLTSEQRRRLPSMKHVVRAHAWANPDAAASRGVSLSRVATKLNPVVRHYGWDGAAWWEESRGLFTSREPMFGGMATMIHLGRARWWRVVVRGNSGLPISFSTDAHGVAESFRLRDIASGAKRRAALLHWVDGHWRKRRDDPDAVAWVRRHMRGATSFDWNGMQCKIRPSREDVAVSGSSVSRFDEATR
jgi:hypothetical protein